MASMGYTDIVTDNYTPNVSRSTIFAVVAGNGIYLKMTAIVTSSLNSCTLFWMPIKAYCISEGNLKKQHVM